MCPLPAGSTALLLVLIAASSAADVRLEVAGQLREDTGGLAVRVDVANRGDAPARAVQVEGELLGAFAAATIPALAPGATVPVELRFAVKAPRPGVHGVGLHLRYVPAEAAPGAEPFSQRASLLLALGANPPPPVRIAVPEGHLAREGVLNVRLESADGLPHRVRLRVLAPRGLNALEPEAPVDVPATGTVAVPVRLLRAGAPTGARAGLVVLAAETEGPLERTAVGAGTVEVGAPPAPWLPRLRLPLVVFALALLAAAFAIELVSGRSRPA